MAWLIVFLTILSSAFGGIEQFFKKAEGKTVVSSMRNIDYIYVINLDARPQKMKLCTDQLRPFGIFPYRFSAVNGWEDLNYEMLNQIGVKLESWMEQGMVGTIYLPDMQSEQTTVEEIDKTYFCHDLRLGAIGIILSHLSVLQDAYDSGYETIWVMEDDIEIVENPQKLSYYIDQLDWVVGKGGWDILFTDTDSKNPDGTPLPCTDYAWRPNFSPADPSSLFVRETVGRMFVRTGMRYGAYSMVVRRSGMKKILDFVKEYHIYLPYDLDYIMPPDIHLFSMSLDVVSTIFDALSDNRSPGYKND